MGAKGSKPLAIKGKTSDVPDVNPKNRGLPGYFTKSKENGGGLKWGNTAKAGAGAGLLGLGIWGMADDDAGDKLGSAFGNLGSAFGGAAGGLGGGLLNGLFGSTGGSLSSVMLSICCCIAMFFAMSMMQN